MLGDEDKQKLVARLKRVEGQVRGVMRMVEDETYCIDVMHQVAAVQGALSEVSKQLLSRHLDTCVRESMESKSKAHRDRVLLELEELFARYGRIGPISKKR